MQHGKQDYVRLSWWETRKRSLDSKIANCKFFQRNTFLCMHYKSVFLNTAGKPSIDSISKFYFSVLLITPFITYMAFLECISLAAYTAYVTYSRKKLKRKSSPSFLFFPGFLVDLECHVFPDKVQNTFPSYALLIVEHVFVICYGSLSWYMIRTSVLFHWTIFFSTDEKLLSSLKRAPFSSIVSYLFWSLAVLLPITSVNGVGIILLWEGNFKLVTL